MPRPARTVSHVCNGLDMDELRLPRLAVEGGLQSRAVDVSFASAMDWHTYTQSRLFSFHVSFIYLWQVSS